MTDGQPRQYLHDVPRDIQDLIYDERESELVELLMKQKGQGRRQAAKDAQRIATRMRTTFPEVLSESSAFRRSPLLTPRQKSIISWTIVCLPFLVGGILFAIGVNGLALGVASKSWPSVEGRILNSEVERRISGESDGDRTWAYHLVVTYEFTVNGSTYKGDRVACTSIGRGNPAHPRKVAKRYPKGSSVPVYYKPNDPSQCLLEPGIQAQAFIIPSVGFGVLLVGGVFLLAQLSVMRDERQAAVRNVPVVKNTP